MSPPPRTIRKATALGLALLACVVGGGCDRGGTAEPSPIQVMTSFGEVGLSPGQFSYPRAMAAVEGWGDRSASLVVIDKAARVQRLDAVTGDPLGGFMTPEHELGKPAGVTVATHPMDPGRQAIYVADTHYHRVLVYDLPEGREEILPREPILQFGGYGTGDGEFVYTTDVAVLTDSSGDVSRIYVSEYGGNDRISIFDVSHASGGVPSIEFVRHIGAFGSPGDADASEDAIVFNRPQSMEIDRATSELIVADACNHRIGRFTLDGELIAWIGGPDTAGSGGGAFRFPYGLTLLDGRTALVAEFGNSRVQHIDLETGASLGFFGEPGRGEGQLATPWAITVIGRDAYVLDSGNNRVLGFRAPGRAAVAMGGTRP